MAKGLLKKGKDDPVAAKIRKAIGATDTDVVEVTTPQFEREPGYPQPAPAPKNKEEFGALSKMTEPELRRLGLRAWGRKHERTDGTEYGPMLWLFPGEWYSSIPTGLPIFDIFFHEEKFKPGKTDNDIRFGCLPFGIIREEES